MLTAVMHSILNTQYDPVLKKVNIEEVRIEYWIIEKSIEDIENIEKTWITKPKILDFHGLPDGSSRSSQRSWAAQSSFYCHIWPLICRGSLRYSQTFLKKVTPSCIALNRRWIWLIRYGFQYSQYLQYSSILQNPILKSQYWESQYPQYVLRILTGVTRATPHFLDSGFPSHH